jgi:hypothetical protein
VAAGIAVSVAQQGGTSISELHVAAVTDNGSLLEESLIIPNGSFGGPNRLDPAGSFRSVALASSITIGAPLAQLKATLVAAGADGRIYQSRGRDGAWPAVSLVDTATAAGEVQGDVVDVAVTADSGATRFLCVTGDGHVWLASQFTNSTWAQWVDLEINLLPFVGQVHHDVGTFNSITAATTSEGLHVLGTTTNGQLWHQLRSQFDPQFRDVELVGVQQDVGLFTAVDCASTP